MKQPIHPNPSDPAKVGVPNEQPKAEVPDTSVPETEDETIARLAVLNSMAYDRVRKEEATALGIQTKTLDELVKAARADKSSAPLSPFREFEPADDPVDPASMLNEMASTIMAYIVLDAEQADAAALWVAHTYLADEAGVSPIVIINAPERACAKTLFQTVLGRMVYRPLFASNASLSALFRSIECWRPTILIDEADTFFRDNSDLHGMINAGYKQGGFVLRTETNGDSFEPKMFSVYSPKSIAGISLEKHLPDATMSRGIVFNMRRKTKEEKVERFRYADDRVFDRISSQLLRFAQDYSAIVRKARPEFPEQLSDRAQDNWECMLAIAGCAGPEWERRAVAAALKMSGASESQGSSGNDLLADIREVLGSWQKSTIRTTDLIEKLIADDDMGWATYNRGRPVTPKQVARFLEPYGIKPKTVRQPKTPLEPNGSTPKGYELAQFVEAFTRYLKATSGPEQDAKARPKVAATAQQHALECDTAAQPAPLGDPRFGVADTSAEPPSGEPPAVSY